MDFSFSDEQLMVIDEARKFTEEKLLPFAEELDAKGEVNFNAIKELGELGYFGMLLPDQYGGADFGYIAYAGAMVEFSKGDPGTSVALSVQNSLVNQAILRFGNDNQKKEFLPKLAAGEYIGCFSLSEANAGSDPGSMSLFAEREDEHFILNGSKNFTTNGSFADLILVFAQTDKSKGSKGISAFAFHKDIDGFSVGKHENKMGIRTSSTTELIFEDCKIPADCMLGEENKGLKMALTLLDGGRIGIAAQAIGIAEAALEDAIKYANERVQFGAPISNLEGIQFMIAEMATEVEIAKSMLYRVAWMKESGQKDFSKESAMLKLYSSEMAHRVCHKALQVHGGYGYMKEYRVERLYRDQRITEIYEGTSEIQKFVIARNILELNK